MTHDGKFLILMPQRKTILIYKRNNKSIIAFKMKQTDRPTQKLKGLRLSDRDLNFLVETVSPEITDKLKLKQIIREDEESDG